MNISKIAAKMIEYSNGDLHDINHFMKVYAYAKLIGEGEGLDSQTQETLEVAAILHDIACPLCREKYGNTSGPLQEKEGAVLAEAFLKNFNCPDGLMERVIFLVGHNHTLKGIEGMDYQILVEADYLVNADEGELPDKNIRNMMERVFKTKTGIFLLKTIYQIN